MELDKWQKREAEQYGSDNGMSYDAAAAYLFGGAGPTDAGAEAPVDPEAPGADAPAPVNVSK